MIEKDYKNYSTAELREALSTIDGNKYPENKAALEAELERRIDSGEVEREEQERQAQEHEKEQGRRRFARSAQPWIGLYLMGAPLILVGVGTGTPTAVGWGGYAIWGLVLLYVGAAVVAGYGLWKRKNWSRRLAIGIFALQAINFQSEFMVYSLTSAIAAFFYVAPLGTFEFGVSGELSTGAFQILFGDLPFAFTISFNLFAIFMIWVLLKARQPLDGEESGIDTYPGEPADRPDLRP